VAEVLASSFAARPVFCDLLSAQAAALEHHLSAQVAAEHKRAARADVTALGRLIGTHLPELGEHWAPRPVVTAVMVAGTSPAPTAKPGCAFDLRAQPGQGEVRTATEYFARAGSSFGHPVVAAGPECRRSASGFGQRNGVPIAIGCPSCSCVMSLPPPDAQNRRSLMTADLDPTSTAVVMVDLQWPYFEASSPVYLDGGESLPDRSIAFADAARAADARVIWTATRLRPGVPVGRTTKRFPFKESNRDTWSELAAPIEVPATDLLIHKPRHSAFFGTDLDSALRSIDCRNVVIAGITSNVCCLATAIDAAARDYAVWWADDLIMALPISRPGFDVDAETVHRNTTALVAYSVGTVVTADEVLAALGRT
jgi:nicotinamidase-related amidase